MRRCARLPVILACLTLMLAQAGCSVGAGGARFLALFGITKKPVIIALVAKPGVLDPFTPHEGLRKAMSDSLDRPVRLDLCLPIQLQPNLDLGFYDFAVVTAGAYAGMPGRDRFDIVAVTEDVTGTAERSAVLIVPVDSAIRRVEDLRGKRVAFGPQQDGRTHLAAIALLQDHGLKNTDLQLSLLPVPGLRHMPDMREVAQTVVNESTDAGFMDEAAYDALPATADGRQPARDRLRVVAKTIPIAETLIIRSPKAETQTVRQVTDFLFAADTAHPEALRPLLVSGYRQPDADLKTHCDRLVPMASSAAPGHDSPD